MRSFVADFRERRREVRRYLAILRLIERNVPAPDLLRHDLESRIFRGGAILIIYNAVEASARSAIQAIYDEIRVTGTPFESLRSSIRKRVISDFRKNADKDRDCNMMNVALDLVIRSFSAEKLFSGNVDARELRDQASDYGFPTPVNDYGLTRNGAELVKVKQKRNDLAHGVKSFSDVGKEYSLREIIDIGRFSMAYMSHLMICINQYLDSADYIEKSA